MFLMTQHRLSQPLLCSLSNQHLILFFQLCQNPISPAMEKGLRRCWRVKSAHPWVLQKPPSVEIMVWSQPLCCRWICWVCVFFVSSRAGTATLLSCSLEWEGASNFPKPLQSIPKLGIVTNSLLTDTQDLLALFCFQGAQFLQEKSQFLQEKSPVCWSATQEGARSMLHPMEQLRVRGPVSNAAGILPEHLYWFVMQPFGTVCLLKLNFWF